MQKMYAIVGIDGEVYGMTPDLQKAHDQIAADPFGFGLNVVKAEYNDAPITERGEKLKADLLALFKEKGLRNFHMNKQIGFYALSIDDRYQLIYDMLTDTTAELLDFGDANWREAPKSKQPKVDVRELCSRLHDEGSSVSR